MLTSQFKIYFFVCEKSCADNYNVICNSTAILGANENKATNSSDDSKQNLIINCISFCGGTEIK